jgi:anti-sigma factor RsiW
MKTCNLIRKHAFRYLSGEMPPRQRRLFVRHVERCPHCQAELRRQRAVVYELQATLPRVGRPQRDQLARVWGNVQQQLTQPPRQTTRPLLYQSWGAAMMMVVMFMLLLPLVVRGADQLPHFTPAIYLPTAVAVTTERPNAIVLSGPLQQATTPTSTNTPTRWIAVAVAPTMAHMAASTPTPLP